MEAINTDPVTRRTEGPGRLLTDARLKLGLEPQNVAEMLHLREYQIRALESDDYENLPEPTYVKGYLRAYCQLLSIDPDRIIKMYSDTLRPPTRESFEGLATEKQAASNDNLVKLVSIAMVALVAGLAITFWLTSREPTSSSESEPASAQINPVDSSQVPMTVINEPETTLPESSPASEPMPVPESKSIAKPESENPTPTASLTPTMEKPVAPAPPVTENPATTPVAPVTSSAGISNEASLLPETDARAHSRLLVKVMQESWVDVRDAKGNKLIYESVPAGREIPLEGLAPFSVFLGNANGVQVFLNGKPYDFSSSRHGLTARFKLAVSPGSE